MSPHAEGSVDACTAASGGSQRASPGCAPSARARPYPGPPSLPGRAPYARACASGGASPQPIQHVSPLGIIQSALPQPALQHAGRLGALLLLDVTDALRGHPDARRAASTFTRGQRALRPCARPAHVVNSHRIRNAIRWLIEHGRRPMPEGGRKCTLSDGTEVRFARVQSRAACFELRGFLRTGDCTLLHSEPRKVKHTSRWLRARGHATAVERRRHGGGAHALVRRLEGYA